MADQLRCILAESLAAAKQEIVVFFRADDVGVPSRSFAHLVKLFRGHTVPLTLAVVPAWLTCSRWQQLADSCGGNSGLWAWIQHGWRHCNHEKDGKKQEFGPSRSREAKRADLLKGFQRLSSLINEELHRIFTPPWNRCDQETLAALSSLGYRAISASGSPGPLWQGNILHLPVTVDLHTRKETSAEEGWNGLWCEMRHSMQAGFCGFMIHHQRMNRAAFRFLDFLLETLKQWQHVRIVHLGTLGEEKQRQR